MVYVLILKKDQSFLLINSFHNPFFNDAFRLITMLGDGVVVVVFCIVLGLFKLRYFLLTILSYLLSGLFVQILKRWIFSELHRPLGYFNSQGIEIYTIPEVNVHLYHSFPSGHTASAFALFFCLAFLSKKIIWKFFFLLLAILVGYSRIYLAQHFPSDVMAGSLIGVFTVILLFPLVIPWNKSWLEYSLIKKIIRNEG